MLGEICKSRFSVLSVPLRLHGSYERLWAGQVSEALVDLSGGLAERWSLGDYGSEMGQKAEQDSHEVRRRRLDLKHLSPVKDQCAVSCSTHSSPGGQEAGLRCTLFWFHVTSSDVLRDCSRC